MDTDLLDRLPGESEAREKSPGLDMSDLLTLPGPLSGFLKQMIRQGPAAFADIVAFFGGDETQARLLLADLLDKGFISKFEMGGVTKYRVRLTPKRGRALPANLWQTLDEKAGQGEEEQR